MLAEFVKRPPAGHPACQADLERAAWWVRVMLLGTSYYLPVTREIARLFGIKTVRGKPQFGLWEVEKVFDDGMRSILHAVYLQMRDRVGAEIQTAISDEVKARGSSIGGCRRGICRRTTAGNRA